jgi:hypothetical protein
MHLPMDDAFFDECQEAVANLSQHFDGFFFWSLVASFDIFAEISVAELLNDVVIFGAFHHIVEHDDIFAM